MKIIGSKMAAKLAVEKFGENAYVSRCGKIFAVGYTTKRIWGGIRHWCVGTGKSWERALVAAGVEIPAVIVDNGPKDLTPTTKPPFPPPPDTMPEDTDAKEPLCFNNDGGVVEKLGSPDEEE